MKILVDKEGLNKISQLIDASLKAHGNTIYPLVTEILGSMEVISEKIVKEKVHEELKTEKTLKKEKKL